MGQKAVPTALNRKHFTKAEREKRFEIENKIRGKANNVKCPNDLTRRQKNYFRSFVKLLAPTEILSSLDVEIIRSAAICADRVHSMNKEIDEDPGLLKSTSFMSALKFYTMELDRCLVELGMTPQARAKIAVPQKEEDPIAALVAGNCEDDDEEDEAED